jgi:hypothetical protein
MPPPFYFREGFPEMLVKATQNGFVGSLRKAGDEFEIPEPLFAATWMEKWNPKTKAFESVEMSAAEADTQPIVTAHEGPSAGIAKRLAPTVEARPKPHTHKRLSR